MTTTSTARHPNSPGDERGVCGYRCARDHLASEEIVWLNTSRDDWHNALRWLEKFSDQKLSFTDCLSFSLMRREGIPSVFGFDHHFALAGCELWPRL